VRHRTDRAWRRRHSAVPANLAGLLLFTLDHRSNAFYEAMNGMMQQAKRAARGFRKAANFIAIAYLRLGKLTHLPASPFVAALPKSAGVSTHRL